MSSTCRVEDPELVKMIKRKMAVAVREEDYAHAAELPDHPIMSMYHEIEQPYEFLWRLRPSLKPDGLVVVVDADRETRNHGTPPALLKCEFAAVGYTQVDRDEMPSAGGYLATFKATGPRPKPEAIRACRLK